METIKLKFPKEGGVRVRFAPSPTGFLHIGSARTALFNYLFARQNEGTFILRIEDTDISRGDKRFEEDIYESLKWLGIEWDELYRQSDRLEIYEKYLKKILDEDKAYYCFCSEEELEEIRQYQISIGETPHYNGKCSQLSAEEVKKNLKEGKSAVIRLRLPAKKVVFEDIIRGKIEFDTGLFGDMVIAKDLKKPLFLFSNTVDDFEMKISHVIRAEEHLSNTPRQILIQEILGFNHPRYGHVSLILAPDRTKLSKRHGATAVSDFRKMGYLPETIVNFIAFLGWNPGTDREIYSLASLVKDFSLDKVQKAGAIFNIKRLDFLNGFYIRQRSTDRITEFCIPYWEETGLIESQNANLKMQNENAKFKIIETGEIINFDYLKKIVVIYQERLKKLSEIAELTDFFFKDKLEYDRGLLKWKEMTDSEIKNSLEKLEKILSGIEKESWTKENLEKVLMPIAEATGDRGKLLWPLRAALSGQQASAGPFEIAEILGKEKTLERIERGIDKI